MADINTAIHGLECCILRNPDDKARCSDCLYEGNCVNRLKMDVLKLLKEYKQLQAWAQGHGLTTCKNCKHGEPYPDGDGEIYGVVCDGCWHDDNWFCADGDPKEDNLYV